MEAEQVIGKILSDAKAEADKIVKDAAAQAAAEKAKADAQLAEVPVIVITAKVLSQGRKIVEDLPPVDDYITKPFNPERLIRSVQNLLPK